MSSKREAVITGIGVVSPIGIGRDAFWDSLRNGRSGVGTLSKAADTDLPVRFGGEVKDFEAKLYVKPRKSLKVMCREIQIGYSAAVLALEDAGLAVGDVDPDRVGVVFGSEMFNCDLDELAAGYRKCVVDGQVRDDLWGESAMSDLYPLWMLKYLPNMTACHIAIAIDARGPNNTITMDEASSLLALVESTRVIERGHADVMITGGSGSRIDLTRIVYRGDIDLSHRGDQPQAACRPFDADRDGGVIGEGGGVIVLESREHAEARGASIIAAVRGCGHGFEACLNGEQTDGSAVRLSIQAALRDANMEPGDIGHVNANGSSMIVRDQLEAQAIHDCLGEVPVTAPRSFFGCLAAGSGGVEMLASMLALAEGEIPVTLNYETPDPKCPVNVICGQPMPVNKASAMLLNNSETGQAVAVVIGR